ncbi:hypothetical protein LEP1GSC202_2654 [Leptospira yanagawae serovar Saopaulo str. Sao Paulo = ATCC 700523]|uniref:Uncharacterized protein n=1 Tax=Leptospira yanagawae serovar Saopaulo str. Sao Paulo = ATCC 700523 TaxID=1249483 RepID=A0A5E8HAT5_9LEPT|nr:hypothetical protein [Leptospira yanagawae]EOQ87750.1 hypothetical protein LEP1GSC202_2654 [Leptospira yanagawae serovar Saopaulo str. Sao Paulo = ATCC 700523]
MLAKYLRIATFFIILLTEACIPNISKSFMQSVSDFLQLRSLLNTGPFQISVRVSGLLGSGLVLNLNSGKETITVNADGTFQFSTPFTTGQDFNLAIQTQPSLPNQTCSVSGGTGVVGYGNINSIIVNCDPLRYTLGGTITGLDGIGFTLTNSYDGSTLPVAVASGTFAFTQTYEAGTPYNVTVATQPNHPVQNCLITNGSNTFPANNVTTIAINCTSTAFPIEITAIGIASGSLTLSNNGSETIVISSDGLHRFPTNLAPSSTYNVQIVSAPANHQCVLSSTSGTIAGTVSIQANCFSVNIQASTPRNGGILLPTESLRLVFTAEVNAGSCVGSTGTLTNTTVSLPVQFALATTNFTNDTLVVTPDPTDSWQSGHRSLTLNCLTNLGAVPLSTSTTLLYLIPSNIRYVADAGGNDWNDGLTALTPKRNIQEGINSFFGGCPSGDCAVLVAQGSYDPAYAGGLIQLESGVSVFGSYEPGFTEWRPQDKDSIILMNSTPAYCAGSTDTNPCASIASDVTITSPTVVSGFRLENTVSAPYMASVFLNGTSNVRLIDNEILAGDGIDRSYGVLAINSSPYLVLNQITGGDCTNSGCITSAVSLSSTVMVSPILIGNVITAGNTSITNGFSKAFDYTGTSGMNVSNIRQNEFRGVNLPTVGSTNWNIAFDVAGTASTGVLAGNLFVQGNANRSYGIRFQAANTIQIGSLVSGNVITGNSNSTTETAGIRLISGTIVRGNSISIGRTENTSGFTAFSYGIFIQSGGTATIEYNAITGGSAISSSVTASLIGIQASGLNATSSISRNYIRMGTATGLASTSVTGIHLISPLSLLVSNNLIQNGSSSVYARGIFISGAFNPVRIFHNTVNSGVSSVIGNESAIHIDSGSGMLFENNILLLNTNAGNNVCLRNVGLAQGSIRSNVFHNCNNLVFQSLVYYTDICAGGVPGSLGCITPLGLAPNFGENLNLNPNLVSPFGVVASYIPTSATSCQITRATNNILADSFNGIGTRPGGDGAVSIGAIEYDLPCTP